ncbi:MAG TPA: TIR domain-containing protein [Anaerolineae bacterium]|nr:TIR domain-containing protein [Anaerolineae bacterium]
MNTLENEVFISYAWGGESERIVNQIDQTLQQKGIKLIRDKRDLGFKGSIKQFMERIGRGNCVIVVISDKYLCSSNCMFELIEIAENQQFYNRIFPIVLQDANIYKAVNRIKYIKYWEDQLAELNEAIKTINAANLQGITDEMNLFDKIRDNIARLTDILKDMNTLTPDMHENANFNQLIIALEQRLKETQETSPPGAAAASGNAVSTRTVSIEGEYDVIGENEDGSTYRGTATITREGEYYRIVWFIAGDRNESLGYQEGITLRCDEWSVVYEIKEDGTLEGKWDNAGTEKLIPKTS